MQSDEPSDGEGMSDESRDETRDEIKYTAEKCSPEEMQEFTEDLLMYHCVKSREPNCQLEVETGQSHAALAEAQFSLSDLR